MASDLNSSDCLQSETGNKLVNNDEVVCVTGAGGFIGSWLVKRLLEKGYHVRGAVRNPDDEKNIRHLKALEGAEERLTLLKAQLSDLKSLLNAFSGCQGVFHLACSLKDDRNQVIEDAVRGTWNVIDACAEAGVKRMVMTSTIGTIYMDPNRNPDTVVDEECWSDLDYCIQTNNWYCYAKTVAEKGAFERAKEKNLDLVVVNPSLVLGPLLQPTVNASNAHILKYLTGSAKTYANMVQAYVHVKDVAEAHILVYENPKANGRYLCAEIVLHRADLVRILAEMFPQFPHPTKCSDEINPRKKIYPFSTAKLKSLGFHNFIPIHQALAETVASLEEKGFIRPLQEH